MHISAKVDYGVRALLELASSGGPMTGEALATQQGLPVKFLGVIMNDLRRAGIVVSQKGATAGYRLARPASEVTLATSSVHWRALWPRCEGCGPRRRPTTGRPSTCVKSGWPFGPACAQCWNR